MNWIDLTIISQIAFTVWFALTHWVPLSPLNDLSEEAFPKERQTNFVLHIFQLASILGFFFHITWLMWIGIVFWSLSFMGHIVSWWLPYFFGWPKGFLENAEVDNAKTYHFLPPRKNHPIPDLNHFIIGILLLSTLITCWMAIL
jgi:hypothetical protein